jgi:hypothetical protein
MQTVCWLADWELEGEKISRQIFTYFQTSEKINFTNFEFLKFKNFCGFWKLNFSKSFQILKIFLLIPLLETKFLI